MTRATCAHCYWCNKSLPGIPETKLTRGRRVVFCCQRHFQLYLARNHPSVPDSLRRHLDIVLRLEERLADLKSDSLFLPDSSLEKQVLEEIIYDLTYVSEGAWRTTRQERSALAPPSRCLP